MVLQALARLTPCPHHLQHPPCRDTGRGQEQETHPQHTLPAGRPPCPSKPPMMACQSLRRKKKREEIKPKLVKPVLPFSPRGSPSGWHMLCPCRCCCPALRSMRSRRHVMNVSYSAHHTPGRALWDMTSSTSGREVIATQNCERWRIREKAKAHQQRRIRSHWGYIKGLSPAQTPFLLPKMELTQGPEHSLVSKHEASLSLGRCSEVSVDVATKSESQTFWLSTENCFCLFRKNSFSAGSVLLQPFYSLAPIIFTPN